MNLRPVKGHKIIMDLKVNNGARHTVQRTLIRYIGFSLVCACTADRTYFKSF